MASTPIELSSKQNPIACSLSESDAASQLAEWRVLRSQAHSTIAIDGGIRLVLPADLRETVEDLAARERACCSFLAITVVLAGAQVSVDIVSPDPAGQVVVEALAAHP